MTRRPNCFHAPGLLIAYIVLAGVTGCEPTQRSGEPTVAETETGTPPINEASGEVRSPDTAGAPAASAPLPSTDDEGPAAPAVSATSTGDPSGEAASAPPAAASADDGVAAETANQDPPPSLPDRKMFDGWESPRLVLLVTGQQHGYIEPCGCTQLANQKGGLARRHTLAKQLAARGWPLVGLDAGNQVRRYGPQAEIKFHMTLDGLKTIGYEAIVLGTDDLRLSTNELVAASVPIAGESTPFVCANAAVLDWELMPASKVIERGGVKIGVTAVVGAEWKDDVERDEVVLKDPVEGLEAVLPELAAAQCDVLVLLAHASVKEAKQLARRFPQFDVVVAAGAPSDGTDPLYQPTPVEGTDALFVQTGTKGMFAGAIGLFDDQEKPLRYQRIPLDASFEDSPEMLQLLKSYQNQLKTVGLAGLGLRPVPHPSGNKFVGSEKCGECHTEAFAVFENTPHATATDSLSNPVERAEIQRHFDPECLSCHVTGWNPQRFFPYTSGYLDLEKSAALHGNGCENCHGPGSAHVAAEEGETSADEAILKRLREAMRLPLAKAEKKCVECHDIDNSPDFYADGAYEHYLKEIEHKGLD